MEQTNNKKQQAVSIGNLLLRQMESCKLKRYERFHIPESAGVLSLSFRHEVMKRGMAYIEDRRMEDRLRKVGEWLQDGYGTPGLMLCGNPGNGKTTVIKAIKNLVTLSDQKDPMSRERSPLEGNTFFAETKAKLHVHTSHEICHLYLSDEKEYDKIKKCGLLAIDDLGVEPVEVMHYGNVMSPITELLYWRYENQLFTIVSSNLPPSSIEERYGRRIYDRLCEMMTSVPFPDITFRKFVKPYTGNGEI